MSFKKDYKNKQIEKSKEVLPELYKNWKERGNPSRYCDFEVALSGCIDCGFEDREDGCPNSCPMLGYYPAWRMNDGAILWAGGDSITEISKLIEIDA